ncbi:MAG: hypothetical protein QXH42_07325 [Thermoplasmata archaeon]
MERVRPGGDGWGARGGARVARARAPAAADGEALQRAQRKESLSGSGGGGLHSVAAGERLFSGGAVGVGHGLGGEERVAVTSAPEAGADVKAREQVRNGL